MKKEFIIFTGLTLAAATLVFFIVRSKNKGVNATWIKPVDGKITSKFGLRIDPTDKTKTQGHNGIDIGVASGTPIKAPMDGVVKIADNDSNQAGGKQVVIQHTNGWFTGYAHLSQILVKVGQQIKQGQVIAYSGATGTHITAAHLHFTLTNDKGVKQDPQKYIYK